MRKQERHVLRIPGGPAQTAATVAAIVALIRDPNALLELRDLAIRVIPRSARTKAEKGEAIYRFVRDRVRYFNDPDDVELVTAPELLGRRALARDPTVAEDCDGHAALVGGLALAAGLPTRLTITEDPSDVNPDPQGEPWWAHIHAEVHAEKGWLPLDSALWWVPFRGRVEGRRSHIHLSDVSGELIANIRRGHPSQLGFISAAIGATAGIIKAAIGARAAGKIAHEEAKAQAAVAAAGSAYQQAQAELDAERALLESEQAARLQAASEAERRAQMGSLLDSLLTLSAGAAGLWLVSRI